MEAAWQVFLEDGYANASMSKIAERLGGSKSTLYNYFRSKDEVFLSVIRHKGEGLYKEIMAFPSEGQKLPEYLAEVGMRLVDAVLSASYTAFYRLVIPEATRLLGAEGQTFEASRNEMLGPLAERLRREMAEGLMPVANPFEAAEVFWNLSSATLHRRALAGMAPAVGDVEVSMANSRAVVLFLNAYRWTGETGGSNLRREVPRHDAT